MPKSAFSLSQEKLRDVFRTFNLPIELLSKQSKFHTNFGDLVNDTRKIKIGDVFCAVIGSQKKWQ